MPDFGERILRFFLGRNPKQVQRLEELEAQGNLTPARRELLVERMRESLPDISDRSISRGIPEQVAHQIENLQEEILRRGEELLNPAKATGYLAWLQGEKNSATTKEIRLYLEDVEKAFDSLDKILDLGIRMRAKVEKAHRIQDAEETKIEEEISELKDRKEKRKLELDRMRRETEILKYTPPPFGSGSDDDEKANSDESEK